MVIEIVTNGSLLTEENMERLIGTKLDICSVSVDSLNEDTFSIMRKGLNLSRILENIDEMNRHPERKFIFS